MRILKTKKYFKNHLVPTTLFTDSLFPNFPHWYLNYLADTFFFLGFTVRFFNTTNFLCFNATLLFNDRPFFTIMLEHCRLRLRFSIIFFNREETGSIRFTRPMSIILDLRWSVTLTTVFNSGKFFVGTTPLNKLWTSRRSDLSAEHKKLFRVTLDWIVTDFWSYQR